MHLSDSCLFPLKVSPTIFFFRIVNIHRVYPLSYTKDIYMPVFFHPIWCLFDFEKFHKIENTIAENNGTANFKKKKKGSTLRKNNCWKPSINAVVDNYYIYTVIFYTSLFSGASWHCKSIKSIVIQACMSVFPSRPLCDCRVCTSEQWFFAWLEQLKFPDARLCYARCSVNRANKITRQKLFKKSLTRDASMTGVY